MIGASTGGSRSGYQQQQSQNQKNKTQLISLFREFERYNNNPDGINDQDLEKIFEGFLLGLGGNSRLR